LLKFLSWVGACVLWTGAAVAQSGADLIAAKGCLGCHDAVAKKVGPSFADVAAKYKADKNAHAKLAAKLKEGKDHPVKAEASDAELKAIVQHVLSGPTSSKVAAKSPDKAPAKGAPAEAPKPAGEAAQAAAEKFDSATCLACHGNAGFSGPGPNGKERSLHVEGDKFLNSVHGKRVCVDCHKDITEIPHRAGIDRKVSCIQCHEDLWKAAREQGKEKDSPRLGVVIEQIDHYMKSIHARPSRADQSRTNATCYNCHDAHYVYPVGSAERTEWRLSIPDTCGKCHAKERAQYATSVHGKEVLENKNAYAAICSDCHSTHDIEDTGKTSAKVAITRNCGNCHADSYATYIQTYHGQVHRLGYGYTAKCFDCHGNHAIQRVADARSSVHPDNRLNTCRKCHKNASQGFVSFEPHATTSDLKHYPHMWVASKGMLALLASVFLFFWTHTALWFYREYKERKERKARPHVATAELPGHAEKQFRRFGPWWRLAHLVFAISVMTLVLSGMAVLYPDTGWAKVIVGAFGSPRVAALVHRTAAAIMLGIFFIQLAYFVIRIARNPLAFDWFGPVSLLPTWKDLDDIIGMFKWFFGRGPRPMFDRWTYWEKFDYWAVFWGMAVIGGSGFMLALPVVTASFLPGWVFNVAMLVHGEEAILAAVFLFTVHFFNNHFRPDKYPPPDIVMFTGSVPLEEFRREHALEYKRLLDSGQLAKYLVDAPSHPMTLGSRILGLVLIAIGLVLLTFVTI
jgi:cytochrome c551/c552/cytochrome b subunit of formate dehydrogenase